MKLKKRNGEEYQLTLIFRKLSLDTENPLDNMLDVLKYSFCFLGNKFFLLQAQNVPIHLVHSF